MRLDQRERLLRKELRKLLPANKDDVASIETITAHGLLAQHAIGDPEWITGWLEFKREHHVKRLSEIAEILQILPGQGSHLSQPGLL